MKPWALLMLALCAAQPAFPQDIVIGQSVPLSGPDAETGRDMRDGALAVFTRANAANGAGRRVQLLTLDNAGQRERSAANTQQLLEQQGALALFGYDSTVHSVDALPLVARHNVLFLAPFSGAASLRSHPNVFTVRASCKAEAARIVAIKRTIGATKAVVIHRDDETGQALYETMAAVFAEAGLAKPRAVAIKPRGHLDRATVDLIAKEAPHYVLVTTPYGVARDFLTAAADHGLATPVAALSFVNPDALAGSIGALARGTEVAQVMPSPRTTNQAQMPVVKDCADALAALNGGRLNATSLESCIAAKVLWAALRKAGPHPTRESLLQAMGGLGRVDMGGYALNFSSGNRHGSQWVDLTMLSRGSRFVQ